MTTRTQADRPLSLRADDADVDVALMGPGNTDDRYTSKYRDLPLGPQFAFGHGLSYTSFGYGQLRIGKEELALEDLREGRVFRLSIPLSNVGDRSGDEVTLVFIRDRVASLAQPVRRLRAFARTPLAVGQTELLAFELGWKDLGFWNNRGPVRGGTGRI
jgi:beta-glucosidase